MSRHVHADLIHAYAEGAEIEFLINGTWMSTNPPQWEANTIYRIKPQEKPWYDQIPPHGVLCWAGDASDEKFIKIIISVEAYGEYRFIDQSECGWNHATPLTNDEIKQFLRGE